MMILHYYASPFVISKYYCFFIVLSGFVVYGSFQSHIHRQRKCIRWSMCSMKETLFFVLFLFLFRQCISAGSFLYRINRFTVFYDWIDISLYAQFFVTLHSPFCLVHLIHALLICIFNMCAIDIFSLEIDAHSVERMQFHWLHTAFNMPRNIANPE